MVAPSARNTRSSASAVRHARVQPILPIIQQPQPFRVGPLALVGEVVRRPRERVQRGDVRPHARRHQPRRDRKILVVRTRKPLALGVRGPQIGGVDVRRQSSVSARRLLYR